MEITIAVAGALALLATVSIGIWKLQFWMNRKNVEWVGHPVVWQSETSGKGWLKTVEIGLRSDGTVGWREITNRVTKHPPHNTRSPR